MRSDDEIEGDGAPDANEPGRIVYISSFPKSWDGIEPAEYALPKGVPALMDDPWLSRRRMLWLAVGGAIAGAGGWAGFRVGRRAAANAPGTRVPEPDAGPGAGGASPSLPKDSSVALRVAGARALAAGPLSELLRHHVAFLFVVGDMRPAPTDPLWEGIERLAHAALLDRTSELVSVRRNLVVLRQSTSIPERLVPLLAKL